jgi:hypothetical protein
MAENFPVMYHLYRRQGSGPAFERNDADRDIFAWNKFFHDPLQIR